MLKCIIENAHQEVRVAGRLSELIAETGVLLKLLYNMLEEKSPDAARDFKEAMTDPEFLNAVFSLEDVKRPHVQGVVKPTSNQGKISNLDKEAMLRAMLREFFPDEEDN